MLAPSLLRPLGLRPFLSTAFTLSKPIPTATTSARLSPLLSALFTINNKNNNSIRSFSSTIPAQTTFNQILRGARKPRYKRRGESPAVAGNPCLKGVCLRVFTTTPKKPNSAIRKVARVKLSTDKVITAYIPGEGHNVQQHSVVLVRGGRSQDCPGVKYHLVRGALDLGGVANRVSSRSKYGAKKPAKATGAA